MYGHHWLGHCTLQWEHGQSLSFRTVSSRLVSLSLMSHLSVLIYPSSYLRRLTAMKATVSGSKIVKRWVSSRHASWVTSLDCLVQRTHISYLLAIVRRWGYEWFARALRRWCFFVVSWWALLWRCWRDPRSHSYTQRLLVLYLMGRFCIAPRGVLPVHSVCNYYCVMSIVLVSSIRGRSIVTQHLRTYGSQFGTTIGMIVSSCGQHSGAFGPILHEMFGTSLSWGIFDYNLIFHSLGINN